MHTYRTRCKPQRLHCPNGLVLDSLWYSLPDCTPTGKLLPRDQLGYRRRSHDDELRDYLSCFPPDRQLELAKQLRTQR